MIRLMLSNIGFADERATVFAINIQYEDVRLVTRLSESAHGLLKHT